MAKRVHARFLTMLLTVSAALVHAQSAPQQVPNMGQQITPLALPGWQFVGLNPGLPAPAQNWARLQRGFERGESGSQDHAGSHQRIQSLLR
jgi:hypothetical protein